MNKLALSGTGMMKTEMRVWIFKRFSPSRVTSSKMMPCHLERDCRGSGSLRARVWRWGWHGSPSAGIIGCFRSDAFTSGFPTFESFDTPSVTEESVTTVQEATKSSLIPYLLPL